MSFFEQLIVQPIFNALMVLYALLPGNDLGIAIIIFAILIRLLMWPLVKKQLRQTKLQRAIQPELKKIKQRAAGDRQLEGQLMLELYRERGINPFAPLGVLVVQLPIFIALYQIITILASHREKIEAFLYDGLQSLGALSAVVADPNHLNENFLGVIDLTKNALHNGTVYWPVLILVLISAFFQYYQSKQITPTVEGNKKLRHILKASAAGKQADQSEISAAMGQSMIKVIPVLAFVSMVAFPIPGALILFYAVSSVVAVVQQRSVLDEDIEDMETLAAKNTEKRTKKSTKGTSARTQTVIEAEVVEDTIVERKVKKPIQKRRKGSKVQ